MIDLVDSNRKTEHISYRLQAFELHIGNPIIAFYIRSPTNDLVN